MNPIRTLKTIMQTVTMYTGAFCPYCTMAKKLLHSLGVAEINEIRVDRSPEAFAEMQQLSGPMWSSCGRWTRKRPASEI